MANLGIFIALLWIAWSLSRIASALEGEDEDEDFKP